MDPFYFFKEKTACRWITSATYEYPQNYCYKCVYTHNNKRGNIKRCKAKCKNSIYKRCEEHKKCSKLDLKTFIFERNTRSNFNILCADVLEYICQFVPDILPMMHVSSVCRSVMARSRNISDEASCNYCAYYTAVRNAMNKDAEISMIIKHFIKISETNYNSLGVDIDTQREIRLNNVLEACSYVSNNIFLLEANKAFREVWFERLERYIAGSISHNASHIFEYFKHSLSANIKKHEIDLF